MSTFLSVNLTVAGLANVRYIFYTAGNSAIGSLVTTGITDCGNGYYSAVDTIPSNAAQIQWDGFDTANGNLRHVIRKEVNTPTDVGIAALQVAVASLQAFATTATAELLKIPRTGTTQVYTNTDTQRVSRVAISADV